MNRWLSLGTLLALGSWLAAGCGSSGALQGDGEAAATCSSLGGTCVLGNVSCVHQAPNASQLCNPDLNPGGAFCCLDTASPDAGSSDAPPGDSSGPGSPGGVFATLDDQPVALAVVGSSVYVALFIQGIVAIPSTGGASTPIVPSVGGYSLGVYFQNPFVFDQTNLYWSESSGGYTSGPIARAPIGGGPTTVLASSLGFTAGIASDADSVYWVDQDQGTINRVPIAGGSTTIVASGLASPGGLTLQNGTLYLTDAAGDLLSVPASGGSVTTLLAGPGLPPDTEVADYSPPVVADRSNVYFSVCPFGTGSATLYRVPLGNGGPPVALASACATGIAVDEDTVYWAGKGSIDAVPIAGGPVRVVATSTQLISAGPAVDATSVYWGITPQLGTCENCPPPPTGQINAVMRAPKAAE